jgi:hypothetical protein
MTTLNDDCKGKSPFQYPVRVSFTLLIVTWSIITLLFLTRFNRMENDIGSLALGRNRDFEGLNSGITRTMS